MEWVLPPPKKNKNSSNSVFTASSDTPNYNTDEARTVCRNFAKERGGGGQTWGKKGRGGEREECPHPPKYIPVKLMLSYHKLVLATNSHYHSILQMYLST